MSDKVIARALRLLAAKHARGELLDNPNKTKAYLRLRLGDLKNEAFGCIFLDNRHRIIETEEMFYGTIDGASVHPRVVAQRCLELNAAAVVFYHNHPSGVAEPSKADGCLTQRLVEALKLFEIRVLDHFVVTHSECTSFAERGLI